MATKVTALMLLIFLFLPAAFANKAEQFPAKTTELTLMSEGSRMSGFIYHAAGKGPHPTILLLHGYPGNEKNLDVAQAMRSKGWNVVFFHYRGAWGSEGEFSFLNAEQDVQNVLLYLSNENTAKTLAIDPQFISTVGHSMGGHMAIAGILDNPTVNCSVSWDGVNLGANGVGLINDPSSTIPWEAYGDTLFMLNGWSGEKSVLETQQHAKELDLVARAKNINGRPVLLVSADTEVVPMALHTTPLLTALKATKSSHIFYELIKDDHSFSSSRKALTAKTADFLNKYCKGIR